MTGEVVVACHVCDDSEVTSIRLTVSIKWIDRTYLLAILLYYISTSYAQGTTYIIVVTRKRVLKMYTL